MSEDVFDGDAAATSPTYADGDVGRLGREHHNANAPKCSNSEFLGLVLAGASGYGWVCSFPGDPGSKDPGKWYGRPWVPNTDNDAVVDSWQSKNNFFCVAELKEIDGVARLKKNFLRLRALVGDDTVEGSLHGTPTWILETSPGNVQTGILIDPSDDDAANAALVDLVMERLRELKLLGDTSGNSISRYVRLPVGTNGKLRQTGPFQHKLMVWHPGQVMSLADACAVFGIDLDELKAKVKPIATDMVVFGDVSQDRLMAEAMHNIVTGAEYHESSIRLAASLSASGMHPGAQVNFLRAIMSSAQAPHDARWQERYDDIPRSVETGARKFYVEPLAAPGEVKEKEPLLVRAGALVMNIKPLAWLVKAWFEVGAMSMIYGPPGAGKSLIAYAIACCVATGTSWHGRPVRQGPVIMVVGEGHAGIAMRLQAWSLANNVALDNDTPLHVTTKSVQILNTSAALELVAAIDRTIEDAGGVYPALIVIDTVARNFGPGDENSTKDAGAFIDAIDELLRKRYGAHVLLVHHTGKDAAAGARGSSAFKAAMDQEFCISPKAYGGVIQLEGKKMKDGPIPTPMNFRLKQIVLDRNDDDEPIDSVVMDLVGSEFDEVIYKRDGDPIRLGQVLDLREGEIAPSAATIAKTFGLTGSKGPTAILRRLVEGGWIEAGAHQTARKKLTEKAMKLLSDAGRLLGDGQAQGGEETGDEG